MKKWSLSVLTLALVFVLAACGNGNDAANNSANSTNKETGSNGAEAPAQLEKLVVGATVPHADILKFVAPALEEEGIELEVKEFTDYVQPNIQLQEKQLDANYLQQKTELDERTAQYGCELVAVASIYVEPSGEYSKKYTWVEEIEDGARLAST